MVRKLGAIVLAAMLMTAQSAFADEQAPPPSTSARPLAPGHAAGLQTAQTNTQLNTIVIVAGAGLVGLTVFLVLGTDYHVHDQNQSSSSTK